MIYFHHNDNSLTRVQRSVAQEYLSASDADPPGDLNVHFSNWEKTKNFDDMHNDSHLRAQLYYDYRDQNQGG